MTLQGLGFSFIAQENVVAVGGASVVGDAYAISEEGTETLSFTVPETAASGDTEILVVVEGNASNTLPFAVEPAP